MTEYGAARSRLAGRESFFGGPLSTREQCKAPNWQELLKQEAAAARTAPQRQQPAGAGKPTGTGAKSSTERPAAPAREPSPNPQLLRKQKLKQQRDFSGLSDDEGGASDGAKPLGPKPGGGLSAKPLGPKPGGGLSAKPAVPAKQQQHQPKPGLKGSSAAGSAAGAQRGVTPPLPTQARGSSGSLGGGRAAARPSPVPAAASLAKPGQQSRAAVGPSSKATTNVVIVKAGAGKGGSKAAGARKLAMEPTAVGKSRKQLATEALQARCDALRPEGSSRTPPAKQQQQQQHALRPAGSAASSPAAAAAAAAAACKAREDAAAAGRGVVQKQLQKTGLGMQTQLLVMRPPGQQGHQAQAGAAAGSRKLKWSQLSPEQQRLVLERRQQQQQQRVAAARGGVAGAGGAGSGRPQGRGSFYGGKQPPSVLAIKRRIAEEDEGWLEGFIDDDDEELGYADMDEEEDWRGALKEVLGGYDASKFAHIDRLPDRDMEVGYNDIAREEARSKRIAREEDAREEELERLREANKREKKRRRKGAAAFLDDD